MTVGKGVAENLFSGSIFLLSACFIRSSYKARYTLSVSAGKAVSGMATERIISGHLPASRSMTIVSAPNNPI